MRLPEAILRHRLVHLEHGLDARVIEIAKPRERTNLEHIKSAFWSQNIITNMYANDTAYDDPDQVNCREAPTSNAACTPGAPARQRHAVA